MDDDTRRIVKDEYFVVVDIDVFEVELQQHHFHQQTNLVDVLITIM
jgi:hypothetical protein